VAALGEVVQVIYADTRQGGDFRVSEDLLAGFYGYHGLGLFLSRRSYDATPFDAVWIVLAAPTSEQ
jgi:hypothetical protein